MTVYAKYPYATLLSVGGKLDGISDQLDSKDKGASHVDGLSSDQQSISDGIDGFRDEWGESIKKLKENIGNFGKLSTQIGTMVGNADADLAKAMRPGGSGGPSAGPRRA